MTIATWIIAVSAAVTALGSIGVQVRHGHHDTARFTDHGERLTKLENGSDR